MVPLDISEPVCFKPRRDSLAPFFMTLSSRNKFVANFFNGTKSFIKENWRMIHQAAGLAALRTWLLVCDPMDEKASRIFDGRFCRFSALTTS